MINFDHISGFDRDDGNRCEGADSTLVRSDISAGDMRRKELEAFDHGNSSSSSLGLLEQIKIAANKRGVPYQSLIKMWLAEKVG
jgi:hypothetical protein